MVFFSFLPQSILFICNVGNFNKEKKNELLSQYSVMVDRMLHANRILLRIFYNNIDTTLTYNSLYYGLSESGPHIEVSLNSANGITGVLFIFGRAIDRV